MTRDETIPACPTDPLPPEELTRLFALRVPECVGAPGAWAEWLEARGRVAASFAGLAWREALRYRRSGDPEDWAQDAMLGILHACDLFDPARGVAFLTYATYWARQAAGRGHELSGRLIRAPHHALAASARRRRGETLPAPLAALADAADRVARCRAWGAHGRDEFDPLSVVPAREDDGPGESEARHEVASGLTRLRERDRRLLELRYGLLDGQPRTNAEVGRELGFTRERARQLEARALSRLRHAIDGTQVPPRLAARKPRPAVHSRRFTYVGVRRRGQRYQALVNLPGGGGRKDYLGSFDTAREAAEARDRAVVRSGQTAARLNFPDRAAEFARDSGRRDSA